MISDTTVFRPVAITEMRYARMNAAISPHNKKAMKKEFSLP